MKKNSEKNPSQYIYGKFIFKKDYNCVGKITEKIKKGSILNGKVDNKYFLFSKNPNKGIDEQIANEQKNGHTNFEHYLYAVMDRKKINEFVEIQSLNGSNNFSEMAKLKITGDNFKEKFAIGKKTLLVIGLDSLGLYSYFKTKKTKKKQKP